MQVIAVEKEGSLFQIASLKLKGKTFTIDLLERTKQLPFLESPSKKTLPLVTGIGGQDILIRHIKTPLKKKSALHQTLPFQLETLLPYSLDEGMIKPIYLEKEGGTLAIFLSVSKKQLEKHLETGEALDPDWVSCTPMALYRFGHFVCPKTPSYLILHAGYKKTEIVSVIDGALMNSLTLHMGRDHFLSSYLKDCPQKEGENREDSLFELQESKEKDFPHLSETINQFKREVDRAFCFLFHQDKSEDPHQILFTGQTDLSSLMERWLTSIEDLSFSPIKIEKPCGYDPVIIKPYALSIGLCLDVLKNDAMSVQFRKGHFVAKKTVKGVKKRLTQSVFLSLGLMCILFFSTHFFLARKERVLHQQLDHFAHLYQEAIPSPQESTKGKRLDQKLQSLNKKLNRSKRRDKYFSPPPLVSDLLAYLTNHPKLNDQVGEKRLEITDIYYTLVDAPSIRTPLSPYKIQVTLAFNTPQKSSAEKFYDALSAGDPRIDPEGKLTFNRSKDHYEISFFFKN